MSVEDRLASLGVALPQAAPPAANYIPFVRSGSTIFVAGQLPLKEGKLLCSGKVGADVSEEEAIAAARLCAINIIAQLKAAADGDLERITRIVRLGAFVACVPEFTAQPKIVNGASDLMVEAFGDLGRHARTAVGTNVLPLDTPVEIDAIAEIG